MAKVSRKNQLAINAWNDTNPPGTMVRVQYDNGMIEQAETAGKAFMLAGTPVVAIAGKGPYMLERLTPPRRDGLGQPLVDDELYYVQESSQFVGNCVLWWAIDSYGYTCDIDKAGRYPGSRVAGMRPTDVGWPCAHVMASVSRFVDWQRLRPNIPVTG